MSSMMHFSSAEAYDASRFLDAIEDFIKRYHDDPQGSMMLYEAAAFHVRDREKSTAVLRRIVKDWPRSGAAREAKWKLRQVDAIGKPFELKFTDAISDREISIESLRGKIVVIDFWATWCAPCVAEMPRMKELYAKWKSQGVEFIGVSLDAPEDQGGLVRLRAFVSDNDVSWPQYHQGAGWQSDFSSSWGVNSIPCVFVIDHEGNLAATTVGDELEETVAKLISQRDAKAAGG
jgi:thiol-disulfide isomerase/thioredoxin